MTPLERAIEEFEVKANDHFENLKKVLSNGSEQEKSKTEKASKDALEHLASEKRIALSIINVQAGLQEYRDQLNLNSASGRAEKKEFRQLMAQEKHHPTDVLAKFMRASGRPQPSPRFTAHHIVQGKGRTLNAAKARVNLHFYNVRINDPDNGVWMPRFKSDKGHWAMPRAAAHSEIHTHNYETWVHSLTQDASDEGMMRAKLIRIRTLLRDGNQPKQVTQPPDNEWSGKS